MELVKLDTPWFLKGISMIQIVTLNLRENKWLKIWTPSKALGYAKLHEWKFINSV